MKADKIILLYHAIKGNEVNLLVYGKDEVKSYHMEPSQLIPGEFRISIQEKALKGKEYLFEVDGQLNFDPRSKMISGKRVFGDVLKVGSHKSQYITDGNQKQKILNIPQEKVCSYQLHLRGFTMSDGYSYSGTFKALEKKIKYLKSLGINQVILMPIYDFEEVILEEKSKGNFKKNFWGFGRAFHKAVKPTFSSRINALKECKDMILKFHENGIEIIMEMNFEVPTSIEYIIDVLAYWRFQMGIDGFYLKGYQPILEILSSPKISDMKLMIDYYEEIHERIASFKNVCLISHSEEFKWKMRQYLKGEISVFDLKEMILRGNEPFRYLNFITDHNGMTLEDLVSYRQKHNEANGERNQDGIYDDHSDNYGFEGITKSRKINQLRKQQKRNALVLLALSKGNPMFLAGDEFGNSQLGNNNPYCQDNEITYIDWRQQKKNQKEVEFLRDLIKFRNRYSIFYKKDIHQSKDLLGYGIPEISFHGRDAWKIDNNEQCLGILYNNRYHSGQKEMLYVIYNPSSQKVNISLVKPMYGAWKKILDSHLSYEDVFREEFIEPKSTIEIRERTILVLKSSED